MEDVIPIETAILLGGIIGLYEAIIIHRDVKVPVHRLGHTIHAILLSISFVLLSLSAEFILRHTPALQDIPFISSLSIQIFAGVLSAIKIHAVSRSDHEGSTFVSGETWFHSTLIGVVVFAAPYLHPLIKPILPGWIT